MTETARCEKCGQSIECVFGVWAHRFGSYGHQATPARETPTIDELAEIAYRTYNEAHGWLDEMPFAELAAEEQELWRKVSKAVIEANNPR